MVATRKDRYDIADLLGIMDKLRAPDGCPWDREQDHASIRRNFLEETYEALEAIDTGDARLLQEELGDVLLQVVFHAQMEKEKGVFDFSGVCDGICRKLILRHPHIFGDVKAETSGDVLRNWDAIKRGEKNQTTAADTLRGVSKALPALMRSEKVQSRAAKAGFDYRETDEALNALRSGLPGLEEAVASGDRAAVHEKLGDLLFSAVNVSRFIEADAEQSLADSCERFIGRFARAEQLAQERGIDLNASGMDLLNRLWIEAK
jgi:tetrapyrrole methylase family protein/MazG family protein